MTRCTTHAIFGVVIMTVLRSSLLLAKALRKPFGIFKCSIRRAHSTHSRERPRCHPPKGKSKKEKKEIPLS